MILLEESLLKVSNLVKNYKSVKALRGISFKVNNGEIAGLLGPNGAGKTTTIQCILGLVQADDGEIFYKNRLIKRGRQIANEVVYIPDQPVFYEDLTVEEHLRFIAMIYKVPRDLYYERRDFIVEYFNLSEYLQKIPDKLSKGTKQKLMISLGFIRDFNLMIADEPFEGLDPLAIRNLKDFFINFREKGKGFIISTHLLDLAETFCNKYIFLNKGKILAEGTFNSIKNQLREDAGSLEELYLQLIKAKGESDSFERILPINFK